MATLKLLAGNLYIFTPDTFLTQEKQSITKGETLFQKALLEAGKGNLEKAIKLYQEAIAINPKNSSAWVNMGTIEHNRSCFRIAMEDFRKAIALDPDYTIAHYNLGISLEEVGESRKAWESYERAIALNPHFGDAHFNLANLLGRMGKKEEAIKHWETFLEYGDRTGYFRTLATKQLQKLRTKIEPQAVPELQPRQEA
jgi:tetratricopeptide (TPR) repeat protein